jgi:hypothetical protein
LIALSGARHTAPAWAAGLCALLLAGCGGGAGTGAGTMPAPATLPTGPNVTPVLVDAGVAAIDVNIPSVSITICTPGGASCQTIDHILLDTGSTGLRIMAAALTKVPVASLPAVNATAPVAGPVFECLVFADGYAFGSVRTADVQLANGKASSLPVQVIGDPAVPAIPADCSAATGIAENTPGTFGANGVLGVNPLQYDCGSACVTIAAPGGLGFYYACPAGVCTDITMALADQIQNPVGLLAGSDHNGVLIVLPAIPAEGAQSATGALVLGIDTESNNQLGSATLLDVDPVFGEFRTSYQGQALPGGFIDSGSNGYFFTDASLTACKNNAGFYCPANSMSLSALNRGYSNGAASTVSFAIASADLLTSTHGSYAAFDNIGGTDPVGSTSFDWGMPFFFGRSVFVGIQGQATAAGTGPFFAY